MTNKGPDSEMVIGAFKHLQKGNSMNNLKLYALVIIMGVLSGCISLGSSGTPGPQGPKGDSGNTTVIVPESR